MGRPCKPLIPLENVKPKMQAFRQRLHEMMIYPDETSAFDAETIRIILEDLPDVERNLLLVYF